MISGRYSYRYRKTGVLFVDLVRPEDLPRDLFAAAAASPRPDRLMAALDAANSRFGRGAVHLGLSAPAASWRMRRQAKTPSWTTSWQEIPVVPVEMPAPASIAVAGQALASSDRMPET